MKNIVLIGMPASGKSTVGVILAKTLGVGFIDVDLIIQQREKTLLQDIIDNRGLENFLDCEMNAVLSLDFENCVISTGGSVVFRDLSMKKLKTNGTVVFLAVDPDTIKARLNNITTRGIAASKTQTIDDIYYERLPLYKKYADIIVNLDSCSAEDAVSKIIFSLK